MRVLYTALVLLFSATTLIRAAEPILMQEIIAKINGEIVTSMDVRETRAAIEQELKQNGLTGAALEREVQERTANILRDRIDSILLIQKAKDLNFNTRIETDVNKRITEIQRDVKVADPEEFERLVARETGRSYEDFRGRIQDEILLDRIRSQEIYGRIQIPATEVRDYYDQHLDQFQRKERIFLRELLVSTDGKTEKEDLDRLEAKAKDLARRAKNGEAFVQMVQNNSDNESTKPAGGLLEPFTKGMLNPTIENQVWDQAPGFVTEPIRFANGWEIFKVEDHQREGLASFAEVEPEIQNRLMAERAGPATRAYLTQLREQAFLQIKDGYVDTSAAPGKDTKWQDVAALKPETITEEEVRLNPSMKRLLGMFPVPGTQKTGASSSR